MWNYSTAMAGTSKGQILLPGNFFGVSIRFGFSIPGVIAIRFVSRLLQGWTTSLNLSQLYSTSLARNPRLLHTTLSERERARESERERERGGREGGRASVGVRKTVGRV